MSLQDTANRFPPYLCRLLAREGRRGSKGRGITHEEFATRAGLARSTVMLNCFKEGWPASTPIGTIDAFLKAAKIDPHHTKRTLYALRHRGMPYTENGEFHIVQAYTRLLEIHAKVTAART